MGPLIGRAALFCAELRGALESRCACPHAPCVLRCVLPPPFVYALRFRVRHAQDQLYIGTPCDIASAKNDTNRMGRWSWAGQTRTASGMLLRVAWCTRCLLPLLFQPNAALLSQMATHAVSRPSHR